MKIFQYYVYILVSFYNDFVHMKSSILLERNCVYLSLSSAVWIERQQLKVNSGNSVEPISLNNLQGCRISLNWMAAVELFGRLYDLLAMLQVCSVLTYTLYSVTFATWRFRHSDCDDCSPSYSKTLVDSRMHWFTCLIIIFPYHR